MISNKVLAAASIIAVVAAIAYGFYQIGSPAEQRALRLDSERLRDLAQIVRLVESHWRNKDELPVTLSAANSVVPDDPATGEPYTYRPGAEHLYELCASFDRPSRDRQPVDRWAHGAGTHCFEIDVRDPTAGHYRPRF